MHQPLKSYRVDWYVDGDTVRHDVTVRIANGRLQDVEAGRTADAVDLGAVALIPGLFNAHTHLEFSLLSEPIPTAGRFTDWIRAVVTYRREHPDCAPLAIRRGVAECLRSGTTLIGDIATSGWVANDYLSAGFPGVVFQELLGLGDERVAAQCELVQAIVGSRLVAEDRFEESGSLRHPAPKGPLDFDPEIPSGAGWRKPPGSSVLFGLSPHAPYSVHPDLFRAAINAAVQFNCPLAIHLAETSAELELLADGTGEFRELLTEFGIWRDGLFGRRKPMEFLMALAECPRALVVHGNYLDDSELQFLARHPQLTLVYCPRTHAAFGHSDHPWRRVLELGGSVAIGTDSRASNPDLSVFSELQFLAARSPEISHLELLKLGSGAGQQVVDRGHADFCVVEWDGRSSPDPARNLFSVGNRVVGTMIGGKWRFVAGGFSVTGTDS